MQTANLVEIAFPSEQKAEEVRQRLLDNAALFLLIRKMTTDKRYWRRCKARGERCFARRSITPRKKH